MSEDNGSGAFQKSGTGENTVPAGTRLIAIASNECMTESSQELSQSVYDSSQEFSNLDQQAYTWTTPKNLSLVELNELANNDPCIIGLANDAILSANALPNDPFLSNQTQMTSIGAKETYAFFSDKGHGSVNDVIVAVIDSGISTSHPDLQNQLWSSAGNFGYNFVSSNNNIADDFGHGTNVSGIIAAQSNNGIGVVGVMGHNIRLMTLKVQDSLGKGYISDIVSAINYARANSANVINISMVGYGANAALQSALQTASNESIFIAVAAGNDSLTISTSSSNYAIPALYGSAIAGMMTVGSVVAQSNTRSSFSNISSNYVEIEAPGSGGLYYTSMPNSYNTGIGTSYSAPQVAGAGALVISFFKKNNINYTASMVETALSESSYRSAAAASYFNGGKILDLRGLKEYLVHTYLTSQSGGFNDF